MTALLLIFSCQQAVMLEPLAAPDIAVEMEVESKKVNATEEVILELRLTSLGDWSAEPFELRFEDLALEEISAEVLDLLEGEQAVYRYAVSGDVGSHVLEPQSFSFKSNTGEVVERNSPTIFVDIGVDGPLSELLGLASLPPAKDSPWPGRIKWALCLLLLSLGLWWLLLKRSRKSLPQAPPVPADKEALAAWAAVGAQAHLDDHTGALARSQIFRRYLERVFSLPASAFTSAEILSVLRASLSDVHLEQSQRLLKATDRIKYARRGGGVALFESLDSDFRELIEETRPPLDVEGEQKHV